MPVGRDGPLPCLDRWLALVIPPVVGGCCLIPEPPWSGLTGQVVVAARGGGHDTGPGPSDRIEQPRHPVPALPGAFLQAVAAGGHAHRNRPARRLTEQRREGVYVGKGWLQGGIVPVRLEYWVMYLTCGFSGARVKSCCELVLIGESAEDGPAAYLVVDEVDHARGLGFGLDRCELSQGAVWSRGVEMVQVDRENLA